MKTKFAVGAIVAVLSGCTVQRLDCSGQSGETVVATQRIEDWGEVFPHIISGPTLVYWQSDDDASGAAAGKEYGVRLQTEASGIVRIRFKGCTVDGVKRAFDLMRSKAQKEDTQWTWTVPCPSSAIPQSARLIVEPVNEGYSYLELEPASIDPNTADADAGAAVEAATKSTYLVIPNQCANLVKHFEITQRAASLPAGSTEPEWERDKVYLRENSLIPLACGRERMASQTASELGVSQFGLLYAMHRAVVLRRSVGGQGDTDVLFHAIDGESVDTLWNDPERLLTKLKGIGTQIGATVSTRQVDGVEELDVVGRNVPVGLEAWDMQTTAGTSGSNARPMHRRWGQRGKLVCLSGADPNTTGDSGASVACDADSLELAESWDVAGTRTVWLQVSNPNGSSASVALPDCVAEGEAPNWKSILGLGSVKLDTRTWLKRMEEVYRATGASPTGASLPCLVPRTCRITIPSGTDLSREVLVRTSLNSKSLLSKCSSQCKGTCADVELALAGDVTVGTDTPFSIDKDKLPAGMTAVRMFGAATDVSIRVAEAAANKSDGTYVGTKVFPALTVTGGVKVMLSNVRFVASETNGTPRTPAPALARAALEITGSATAGRPTVQLEGVRIDGDEENLPLYEGLRAKGATLYLRGSQVRAYKRAVGVEDTALSLVGAVGSTSEIRSGILAEGFTSLYALSRDGNGKPISLAGSAKNFPALDLGSGTTAFVGKVEIVAPLGLVWADSVPAPAGEANAVFYDVNMGGGTTLPESMQSRAIGMLVNGAGVLRFVKLRVTKTYMPIECAASGASGVPKLSIAQEDYSCAGTSQSQMAGLSLCGIEQSTKWERDEDWPGCVYQ